MRSRSFAVITGFYAGWPEYHNGYAVWHKFYASDAEKTSIIRRTCEEKCLHAVWKIAVDYPKNALPQSAAFLKGLDWATIGLKICKDIPPERVAICFSTSKAEPISPLWDKYPLPTCDVPAAYLSAQLGATGPMFSPVAACATGAHAIALGAQLIEDGYADVALCGALENSLSPLMLTAYRQLGAFSKTGVMRPFDRKRDGFIPSEGMAFLVLENEKIAQSRGAKSWARVAGCSMNADATAMTSMCASGESIAMAIETALRRAGNPPIDYINAHGTATPQNDAIEARALQLCIQRGVLSEDVAISSTKPITGHWMGAAGALEAVLSLLAMHENIAPPTLNLQNHDANVSLNLISGEAKEMQINRVLSLSYGFGGHIGVLVLEQ